MATLSQLAVNNLALKGAGVDYNYLNRFFETKAEADAALADNSWTPVAGVTNACLTGDQGLFVYNAGTQSLDIADGATRAYIDAQISSLVDSAPGTLDTLNELAAAINDDPAYFTNAEAARVANTNLINAETSRATAAETAIQADVDQNEADADAAIAALQADVDQNEADADAAIAALQADVDQNEADADAAIAAVQADVDQNEADADAAMAAETTARTNAITALQADVDQNEADADAAIAALQADVDQNEADADAALALKAPLASPAMTGTPTAPTAAASTNTTQIATTAYVDTALASLVDNAPGTLDTLNEIATALGNDANLSTTLTNSIAAVQADVNQNEVDSDAADAALGVRIDSVETEIDTARTNIYTAIGQAEGAQAMGTFTGSTLGDNQTIKQLLQALETANEGEITARTAIAEFASNLTKLKNDLRGTYINVGNNIELRASAGGRVEIVGDLYLDNNTAIDGSGTTLTSFANINAYDGRLNTLEADPTTAAAVAAVQADVDQNEADADAAIAAVQADVDQNEADADAAIALKADIASPTFTGTPTAPTAGSGTNTTQIATTAFVTGAVSDLVNGAPGTLDTLNELAAALNDDTNAATNLTTLINANETHIDNVATLSGVAKDSVNLGTFTGSTIADNQTVKAALQALETAQEATQADVDTNEADADAAIAAIIAGTSIPGTYNNDAAAATGGVPVGGIYKNTNGTIHWRVA
jgi:hypothetical protein